MKWFYWFFSNICFILALFFKDAEIRYFILLVAWILNIKTDVAELKESIENGCYR